MSFPPPYLLHLSHKHPEPFIVRKIIFVFLSLVSFDIRDGTCMFYIVQFSIVISSSDIWFLLSLPSTHISYNIPFKNYCVVHGYFIVFWFFFHLKEFSKDKSKNGIKEKFFHLKTSLVGGSVLFGLIQICGLAMFGLLGFKISLLWFWNIAKALPLVSPQSSAHTTTTNNNKPV